ncbi:hypothetical protein ACFPK1_02585 [Actinomycetospora rhizophila]|uniref:Uncharacterized protein n=1 Tax=Actinomycetospora rhizophila TaxID=1416876 RepID=A0ABV9Z8W2_9PSEU
MTRRPARVAAEPLTMPMPRLADVVHAVTATFGSAGWTLRFGPSGQQVVVDRLADAHAAARRLVGGVLGIPAAAVRIRITPDRATLAPLRRS